MGQEISKAAMSEAAAALGRLGGLKGGPARAKSLNAKERSAIAAKGGAATKKKFAKIKRAKRKRAAKRAA